MVGLLRWLGYRGGRFGRLYSISMCDYLYLFFRHNYKECRGEGTPRSCVASAAYHKNTHILVTGFEDGAFFLHEMPDFNLIHSLRYVYVCGVVCVHVGGCGWAGDLVFIMCVTCVCVCYTLY